MSVEADRLGFTAVMLTEHHFTGYNTFSDPFVFGAYFGFSDIGVGSGGTSRSLVQSAYLCRVLHGLTSIVTVLGEDY